MSRATKFTALMLGAFVLLVAVTLAVLGHLGYGVYSVRSGSMTPTVDVGAAVIDAPVRGPISVGDVVTFVSRDGQALTTHRVVRVVGDQLVTKGDANATVDPVPVDRTQVRGQVIASVRGAGYLLVFLKQPVGVASVMTMAVCLLLLYALFFGTSTRSTDDDTDPSGTVALGPAALARFGRTITRRPCVVLEGDERLPGRIFAWRSGDTAPEALVRYASSDDDGSRRTHEMWLPASRLEAW